jgi:hypothetical protein
MIQWLLFLAASLGCTPVTLQALIDRMTWLAPMEDQPSRQLARLERAAELLQMGLLHLPEGGINPTEPNCPGVLLHPRTLDWMLRARSAEEEQQDRHLGREEWLRAVEEGMEFPTPEPTDDSGDSSDEDE